MDGTVQGFDTWIVAPLRSETINHEPSEFGQDTEDSPMGGQRRQIAITALGEAREKNDASGRGLQLVAVGEHSLGPHFDGAPLLINCRGGTANYSTVQPYFSGLSV